MQQIQHRRNPVEEEKKAAAPDSFMDQIEIDMDDYQRMMQFDS